MADTFELELVTPERRLVKEQVEEAQIPARNGYIGVLAGHAPLLTELGAGACYYTSGGKRYYFALAGGFAEVLPDRVRILADAGERAGEIDVERAHKARERAQEQLVNPALGVDPAVALEAIARAEARLEAATHK